MTTTSRLDPKTYPMSSLDVVKKLSIYLTQYFTCLRKTSCFDLSGPLLPLRHYPARYQRTLIDYQQDASKSVKHYFSSLDLRKRLTSFKQENISEERHKAILNKIEEYIRCITTNKNKDRKTNEDRRPPWISSWGKGAPLTFQSILFMSIYGGCRNKRNFYARFNSTFLYAGTRKHLRKPKTKMRRNYGAQPVLKMCPHPYASRGEAERIINHAAKLILVTENYDPEAYDHTAPGMKVRQTLKVKPKKSIDRAKSLQSSKKDSSTDKQFNKLTSTESNTTNKMNTFKIKKILVGKDYNSSDLGNVDKSTENSIHKMSSDSINDSLEMLEFESDIYVNQKEEVKKKDKESNLSPCCKCKKSVSIEPSSIKKTTKINVPVSKNTESTNAIKEEDGNMKKNNIDSKPLLGTSNLFGVSNETYYPTSTPKTSKDGLQEKKTHSQPSLNKISESFDESSPILIAEPYDHNIPYWLKRASRENQNDNCCIKSSTTFNVKQVFEVKICTGDRIGASTNAKIWLHITGDKGSLKHAVELKKSSTHRRPFCRGNTDLFKIKSSQFLGSIKLIQIGHDSDQPGSDWFLDSVFILDCIQQVNYFFPCYKWLSVRSEDKHTRVNILSQPYIHEAKSVKYDIQQTDVGIQCNEISERNEKSNYFFTDVNFQQSNENNHVKNSDSLSDLAVEFSELSFSESSASTLMSVRRHDRYPRLDIFEINDPLIEDVGEEAIISVKENISDLPIDFNFKNELEFNTENSLDEDAEDSYSPNPISFCDEEST